MKNFKINSTDQLISKISEAFEEVFVLCSKLEVQEFESSTNDKWSPREQVEHLLLSTKPVVKSLRAPRERLAAFGFSSEPPRNYQEIVETYQQYLNDGAKAIDRFIPAKNPSQLNKKALLDDWKLTAHFLRQNIREWFDADLDSYCLPHPLMGNLAIREMLYFTLYHTHHHLNQIHTSLNQKKG